MLCQWKVTAETLQDTVVALIHCFWTNLFSDSFIKTINAPEWIRVFKLIRSMIWMKLRFLQIGWMKVSLTHSYSHLSSCHQLANWRNLQKESLKNPTINTKMNMTANAITFYSFLFIYFIIILPLNYWIKHFTNERYI